MHIWISNFVTWRDICRTVVQVIFAFFSPSHFRVSVIVDKHDVWRKAWMERREGIKG